jgi:predicted HicB family RNase H-like nuclease
MDNDPIVTMTIYAPESLRRRIKVMAASQGTSLTDYVLAATVEKLDRDDAEAGK